MKILFIVPRLPYPMDTGARIRTFNILKQLAQQAEVDLVSFSFEKKDACYADIFKKIKVSLFLVPIKEPSVFKKVITVLFHNQPFSIFKYKNPKMFEQLKALQRENKYDLVHIDHIHMARYQSCFSGTPCFVDEHNVEYRILQRCANVEKNPVKKWIYQSQAQKMKCFERKFIHKSQGCFAVSKDDQDILMRLVNKSVPVYVTPNGVDTEYFNKNEKEIEQSDQLVFTGSMDWLPNDDAIVYFNKEILPLIWAKNKNVVIYIVGKNPSAAIKDMASKDQRVIVTGCVDDVRVFMDKAKVFIVPIRIGGGTRLKILEAMSMQKAIVSTSIGAEGIAYSDEKNIAIADQPKKFANKILSLLKNECLRGQIGKSGRELVCQTYDWKIIGDHLMEVYKKHVG